MTALSSECATIRLLIALPQIQAPVFWFTENLVVACIPLATSLFSRVVRAFMIAVSIRD